MFKLLALLFTGAKFGKLLVTGGSMLVSLVVYAWIFGWRYAAGFIGLLFVHEMGHFIAARHKGLNVGRRPSSPSSAPGWSSRTGRTTPRPRPSSAWPGRCWARWAPPWST
jgi:hypothetical protein